MYRLCDSRTILGDSYKDGVGVGGVGKRQEACTPLQHGLLGIDYGGEGGIRYGLPN